MQLYKRINSLVKLGELLSAFDDRLYAEMHRTYHNNKWFTIENQEKALKSILNSFLEREKLEKWAESYSLNDDKKTKTVGLIMAGNIPLVGFQDFLNVFVSGNKAKIKLSSKDKYLLPYIITLLEKIDPQTREYFEVVERLRDFDAVIATGSNNSSRYFEAYFGKYPNIIRKNRNGVAVLTGKETDEDLRLLGEDIFSYFGLGCRNVSKVYLPKGYDLMHLLEILHDFKKIINHNKYKNNFDYNYAIFELNRIPYKNNGCILLKEDTSLQSRIASLHYEFYENENQLDIELKSRGDEIQCIVSRNQIGNHNVISFGESQQPGLFDYSDGVDTMNFLLKI